MTENRPATDPKAVETIQWLIHQAWERTPKEQLVAKTAERLVAAAVPVARCHVAMYTLHPEIGALTFEWDSTANSPATGQRREIAHAQGESAEWKASPLRHMMTTGTLHFRRRLTGPEARIDFPVLETSRDQGFSDYYACMYGGTASLDRIKEGKRGGGAIMSWMTRHPHGFSDADIAFIGAIAPALTAAIQASLDQEIARNLMNAYVGPLVGTRILDGAIRRGMAESLNAVLMIADLTDFTRASDIFPKEDMVSALNRYFDAILEPVHAGNGQVLKFLGDGFLAIFPVTTGGEAETAMAALDAAETALEAVNILARREGEAGGPVMSLNVALHLGEVMFGNVGSRDRLDFTVIGPAVNETSRMETLCRTLGTDIILSGTMARLLAERTRLLTRTELRGVRGERALYAPAPRGNSGGRQARHGS